MVGGGRLTVYPMIKAVARVHGVTGTTASKNADSFEIKGDFNAQEVVKALNAAGFTAKID